MLLDVGDAVRIFRLMKENPTSFVETDIARARKNIEHFFEKGDREGASFFFSDPLLETLESKIQAKLDMERFDSVEGTAKRIELNILLRKIYLELNKRKA
jgi:hypothetical protein